MDFYPLKRFLAKTTDAAIYAGSAVFSVFDRLMRHEDRFGQTNPLYYTAAIIGYGALAAVPTYMVVKTLDQPSIETPATTPLRSGNEKAEIAKLNALITANPKEFVRTITYQTTISETAAVSLAQKFAQTHGTLGHYGRSQTTLTANDFIYRDECLSDIRYTRQDFLPQDTNLNLTARCMMDARKADHESDLSSGTRTLYHAFGLVAFGVVFAGIGAGATPVYRQKKLERDQKKNVN